jgi:nucleotide-binding universal stress UspA family protein
MIAITHIICPVDFSWYSSRACDYAAVLARWYDAKLTVLHVFAPPPVLDLPAAIEDSSERRRAMNELRQFAAGISVHSPLDLRVVPGSSIANAIIGTAEEMGADLMVLGSHGRTGLERVLLGSVTEAVIRRAPCPALVVPRRDSTGDRRPIEIRRILCAVDFSEASLRAIEYALTLAEESDSELTLLHVIDCPEDAGRPAQDGGDAASADVLARLERLIPSDARDYCAVRIAVEHGAVHRRILDEAAVADADLIVMGVHGRRALDVMMFGSNSARVTRAASCPVMIVRHP